MLSRLNLVLAVVLVFVLAMLAVIRVDYSRPNFQVILGDDMTYSPAYASFEPNKNFASGRTMQSPVPGTIARGAQPFHFDATPEDAIRAGEQLTNPFDLDSEQGLASAERGQAIFQIFCTTCHGADGTGNGPVAQRGFPPPPSLLTGKSLQMKDGQLLHVLTHGQNSMPQFAAQLPPDRRWDVINYIRRLQQDAPEPATTATTDTIPATPPAAAVPATSPVVQPDPVAPAQTDSESTP